MADLKGKGGLALSSPHHIPDSESLHLGWQIAARDIQVIVSLTPLLALFLLHLSYAPFLMHSEETQFVTYHVESRCTFTDCLTQTQRVDMQDLQRPRFHGLDLYHLSERSQSMTFLVDCPTTNTDTLAYQKTSIILIRISILHLSLIF